MFDTFGQILFYHMDTSLTKAAVTETASPSGIKFGENARYARDSTGDIMNSVFDIESNSALQTAADYLAVVERTDTRGRSSVKY